IAPRFKTDEIQDEAKEHCRRVIRERRIVCAGAIRIAGRGACGGAGLGSKTSEYETVRKKRRCAGINVTVTVTNGVGATRKRDVSVTQRAVAQGVVQTENWGAIL